VVVGGGIVIFAIFYLGVCAYVAIKSGFIDAVRYRIRQRREDWRDE
jgi:hypothetical protein